MDLTEFFIFLLNRQGKLKLIYTIVQQLLAKKSFVMNILNIYISFLSYSYPFLLNPKLPNRYLNTLEIENDRFKHEFTRVF